MKYTIVFLLVLHAILLSGQNYWPYHNDYFVLAVYSYDEAEYIDEGYQYDGLQYVRRDSFVIEELDRYNDTVEYLFATYGHDSNSAYDQYYIELANKGDSILVENPEGLHPWFQHTYIDGDTIKYGSVDIYYKMKHYPSYTSWLGNTYQDCFWMGDSTNYDYVFCNGIGWTLAVDYTEDQYFELESTSLTPIVSTDYFPCSFTLHPNPSSDFIEVKSPCSWESIYLVNAQNQVVLTSQIKDKVDVRNLAQGSYILIMTRQNEFVSQKIQVIR